MAKQTYAQLPKFCMASGESPNLSDVVSDSGRRCQAQPGRTEEGPHSSTLEGVMRLFFAGLWLSLCPPGLALINTSRGSSLE